MPSTTLYGADMQPYGYQSISKPASICNQAYTQYVLAGPRPLTTLPPTQRFPLCGASMQSGTYRCCMYVCMYSYVPCCSAVHHGTSHCRPENGFIQHMNLPLSSTAILRNERGRDFLSLPCFQDGKRQVRARTVVWPGRYLVNHPTLSQERTVLRRVERTVTDLPLTSNVRASAGVVWLQGRDRPNVVWSRSCAN